MTVVASFKSNKSYSQSNLDRLEEVIGPIKVCALPLGVAGRTINGDFLSLSNIGLEMGVSI